MNHLLAELRKLLGLRATWAALGLTIALPALSTWANGLILRHALETGQTGGLIDASTKDLGLAESMIALIGITILAVSSAGSEFTPLPASLGRGRQLSTTLLVQPRRSLLAVSKLIPMLTLVAAASAMELGLALWIAQRSTGPYATPAESGAVAAIVGYHLTVALLAHGLTVLLRNGAVPMVIGILNAGVISFGLLLASVTPLVRYLPEMAVSSLLGIAPPSEVTVPVLPPPEAAWTLAAWALLGLGCSLTAWRRDA